MKKIVTASIFCFASLFTAAQGLENIIVEKYYVSDANDASGSSGVLPVGSVTYRVFADLAPGYNFQALYGIPGHFLRLETTTSFFNNEDYGNTNPNGISTTNIRKNSAMIDSWFSVGASCNGKVGVLKSEDTDGSLGNNIGILANADPTAGVPLTTSDGMMTGSIVSVTFVGINNTGNGDLAVLDGISQAGNLFATDNGSVAALGGATGVTASNTVLVAQITTDGVFSFEMNMQIGTPGGGVENYVAVNPQVGEVQFPGLSYNSSSTGLSYLQALPIQLSVFPNPSNGRFSIVHRENTAAHFEVRSVTGASVSSGDISTSSEGKFDLDLSTVPSGIYFLVWSENGMTSVTKLIRY